MPITDISKVPIYRYNRYIGKPVCHLCTPHYHTCACCQKIMLQGEDECWLNKYFCWKLGSWLHGVKLNVLSFIINCAKYPTIWHWSMEVVSWKHPLFLEIMDHGLNLKTLPFSMKIPTSVASILILHQRVIPGKWVVYIFQKGQRQA